MKTAIEKPMTPGGVFDHLMVPQGDEPEFHPTKDPKTMTMQESLEEVDRFLCWNRMSPEEKWAEQKVQRAASHATKQTVGNIPCTMRPEKVPDPPQDMVWEDLPDAPQDVVRADVLDTSMSGMLEAVPSNGAPERAADTMPDDVPDATEGNVPGREADTVPDGPPDDLPDTVEGNMPDAVGALTAQEKAGNETVQGVPEVEGAAPEAIVPLGQIGEDVPAAEERWAYASELIGDAFQHWGNGRVLLDMGTGRGKNEFIIKRLVSWRVDEMLTDGKTGRVLCLCPLNTLYTEIIKRRMEAANAEAKGEPMEIALTYDMLYESMLEVQTYQHIEAWCRNDPASLEKYLAQFKYIVADECHYFTDFSSYGINTYLSLETLQKAEADHVVIYMSVTGEETYKLLEETTKTPEDRIYKLPQDYQHIKQKYFYSRENLVMILKSLPEDEKAVIFVSSGEDLLKMKEIFGDTAAYYCSENNPKYGKMFNKLTDCIKDRELQKRFLFTTKAFGIGTEIKDRKVKHLYIDQWKPTDIIQSVGRKRPLDAEDTCTVYFRDYDADWYYGDLKKFKAIVEGELKPVLAYLAGPEAFEAFRNSGNPDTINSKIRKCRIMEFDDAKGAYRVNPLGVRQLKRELELLNEMLETSYKKFFAKYAPVLAEETVPYCFDLVVDWINAHLNQPMLKEEMYESIMALQVFKEYKGRPMGQDVLNRKFQIYGVEIVSGKNRKRGDYYQKTFWELTRI